MGIFTDTTGWQTKALWTGIAVLGAVSFAIVALNRGEAVNAAWLVVAAVCVYFIAYRFYGLFVAERALGVDGTRPTPAVRHNDGLDYVPTNRYVLYGHHFAAIAGAGPLVGPVLAAQMGYLPGTLWILAGAVFAGAVQDMIVLFLSTRRDGRSLGDMVRSEMGPMAGAIALIGVLLIMMILLAVLALVVVKALMRSPWGTFTVFCTIPFVRLITRRRTARSWRWQARYWTRSPIFFKHWPRRFWTSRSATHLASVCSRRMMAGKGSIGPPSLACGARTLAAGRRAISVPAETCSIATVHCCSNTSSAVTPIC